MNYITDFHALNLPCQLGTTGDWHKSSYNWENPKIKDSSKSIFGDYGIETNRDLTFVDLGNNNNVANHIRACLDIIDDEHESSIKFFTSDFLDNNKDILDEFFNKCLMFKNTEKWIKVDQFLSRENLKEWENAKKRARA